jgi:hypothetical protein
MDGQGRLLNAKPSFITSSLLTPKGPTMFPDPSSSSRSAANAGSNTVSPGSPASGSDKAAHDGSALPHSKLASHGPLHDTASLADRAGEAWHNAVDTGREQIRHAAESLPRTAVAYVNADPLKSLVMAAVVGAVAMAVLVRLIR